MPAARSIPLLALLAAMPAAGQPAGERKPVDETIADMTALSASLREIEAGLLQPNDFDQVYRGPDDRGFMRIQGGLYAVFPRSIYTSDEDGNIVPVVPDGTVFYIGPHGELGPPPIPAGRFANRIEGRIGGPLAREALRIETVDEPPRQEMQTPPPPRESTRIRPVPAAAPAIVADAEYRARRLRLLMRLAAEHAATLKQGGLRR